MPTNEENAYEIVNSVLEELFNKLTCNIDTTSWARRIVACLAEVELIAEDEN